MDAIVELLRLPSPAPRPQSLVFDDPILWMAALGTSRLYAIDPTTWTVLDEVPTPGVPFGLTLAGDEFRVLCESPDDRRTILRYLRGTGFVDAGAIAVPDGHRFAALARRSDALHEPMVQEAHPRLR